ncbi:MAG: FadR family transcriptional regulator [Rhodospirillales bacterium]|nr:FadR family transcriptional regulator [Rhodospirillales bacterium]
MESCLANGRAIVAQAKTQVFEDIFRFFTEQLANGVIHPGDRLLSERELAQALDVSRPSLREAMRALALLGLIDIRPGQGTYVRNPDATVLREFFSVMLVLQPNMYQSALVTREAIECQAIRIACRAARPQDIQRLRDALDRITETAPDPEKGADADFAFHRTLVEASHDEVMLFVYDALQPLLRRDHAVRRQAIKDRPEVQNVMPLAHKLVLDALIAGDEEAADAELRRHIQIPQGYEELVENGERQSSRVRAPG